MSDNQKQLDGFAVALADTVIRFRWLVILLSIAAAAYIGMGAQKLAYDNNYRAFFSEENPELRTFEEFQATYTKNDNFLFVIVPKEGVDVFSNDVLAAVHDLTEKAWKTPYASRVDSITNFQYTYAVGDELIVKDLITDPGETSPEELTRKKAAALAEPLLLHQLINEDSTATTVNVVAQYPEKTLSELPEAVAYARQIREEILSDYPDLTIYLSGASMLSNSFSEAIATDFQTLIPLMIIIILVTTTLCVRSASATGATLLLIILASMTAMGWAGHAGIKLAGPSPSAIIVILTLAIADSIHILISARVAMQRGMKKRAALVEAIRVNFLAVSITSLTTIVGFMALNFSDSPPFRDFGNISAVGILAAWALSLTMLPALLMIVPFKAAAREAAAGRGGFLSGFADFVINRHRLLFVLAGGASAVLIAFIPQTVLTDNFRKYFDERIEFRRDTDALVDYFGFYLIEFSLSAGEPGGVSDPEFLETLDAFTEWLREYPEVDHVYSLADIMKRLNKNLNQDDPAYYRLPTDRELSAQYLLLFELSLPYGLDLTDRINIDKSATRVSVTLDGDIKTDYTRKFLKDAEAWFDVNAPAAAGAGTGPQVMFTFIAQRNVESMVQGTIIAIIAIAIIMVFALRSLSLGLLSMVPNGLPILSAFGAWAILVGEVGFAVAAVASISLGIVIDDTVHFLTKFNRARRENGLTTAASIRYAFETVGVAIIVNTFILTAGFLVLTFSAFKINFDLGLLTTLSIVFAIVLDFLFLPALLMMFAPDKNET